MSKEGDCGRGSEFDFNKINPNYIREDEMKFKL